MEKIGKILKWSVLALIVALVAAILVRIYIGEDDSVLKDLHPDARVLALYRENPDFEIQYQHMGVPISDDGMFASVSMFYIPELEQWQITMRFNRSTVERVCEAFPEAVNTAPEQLFRYTMSDGESECVGRIVATDYKYMYTYQKVIFDGMPYEGKPELMIYTSLNGIENSDRSPFCFYYNDVMVRTRTLTKREVEIMEGAK